VQHATSELLAELGFFFVLQEAIAADEHEDCLIAALPGDWFCDCSET
jgi:hypothetical protein